MTFPVIFIMIIVIIDTKAKKGNMTFAFIRMIASGLRSHILINIYNHILFSPLCGQ